MPSLYMRLGWVLPVDPVELAAHFEAYVDLLPTLEAFRLCHRFGGTKTFSRLPEEVLTHIESFLVARQRQARTAQVSGRFKCFEDRCRAIEHYTKDERKEIRADMISDDYIDESMWPPNDDEMRWCQNRDGWIFHPDDHTVMWHRYGKRRLRGVPYDARSTSMVDGVVRDLLQFRPRNDDRGKEVHEKTKEEFRALVGPPDAPAGGLFHTHLDVLRRHFGLQVWLCRVQREQSVYHRLLANPHLTIEAHLMLPVDFSASAHWRPCIDSSDDSARCEENSFIFPLSPPQQQTQRSLRRFSRALAILDLTPMAGGADSTTSEPIQSPTENVLPELKVIVKTITAMEIERDTPFRT